MNVKNYVWAFLCLYLTILLPIHPANAQALKVGDILPEELWSLPLQVVNHPEGKETITLSEYKDKLIILDFWATWCSPCVAMLPKQDSLQRKFEGNIQIIPLTYQGRKEVGEFMEKYTRRTGREIALPKVIEEKWLHRAFPHTAIPHYAWIGVDGRVKAITGYEEVREENIAAFLSNTSVLLTTKIDPEQIPYDASKPFLINGNGGDGFNLIYHSVLTGYTEGIPAGYSIRTDSLGSSSLTLLNMPLYWFYTAAYGADSVWFGKNRVIFDLKQREKVIHTDGTYEEWERKHLYSYQLMIPKAKRQQMFMALAEDLKHTFPEIQSKIEIRERLCWVLSIIPGYKIPAAKPGPRIARLEPVGYTLKNAFLKSLFTDMNVLVLQNSPYPLIDETGLSYPIDLEINSRLNDMEALSEELGKSGLRLSKATKNISVLVLKDNPGTNQ